MIYLSQIGKRFRQQWIFKGLSYTFEYPGVYGILGQNGSGKSTLLRIIAGMQSATVGQCRYEINRRLIDPERFYRHLSYCAPALSVVEEMTLMEFLHFHFSFKKMLPGISVDKIIELLEFKKVRNTFIHDFSSGMKQRVKLAQAFFADTEVLLLDEPCSNLDEKGIQLYEQLLDQYAPNRLVLIASNMEREYFPARHLLSVEDFKP
ncbi:MAG TPA: ABC transporter ATP-binding protein [Edaphocola sp.]|nr:ABC transporter ATP-binding protein [Edaphocola sp.]